MHPEDRFQFRYSNLKRELFRWYHEHGEIKPEIIYDGHLTDARWSGIIKHIKAVIKGTV